jgi:hypothetical protein
MSAWPLLTITTFLPLVGVLFLLFLRSDPETEARNARWIALWTSLLTFGVSLFVLGAFDARNPGFQLQETVEWIPAFGISYHMGVDGISVLFVLLSTFLTPICILASWEAVQTRVKEYMIAFLVLETMMVGMFCALDLVLFYIFFEGVLIPMFIIIGVWGGGRRVYAAFKFFLYTLLGSVLMLLAILAMGYMAGTTDVPRILALFDTALWTSVVAERWRYRDGGGEVGVISSVTQPFCGDCSRARLSTEGRLYTCLFAGAGHDLRGLVRGDTDDARLAGAIAHLWSQRADRYSEIRSSRTEGLRKIEMSYIGG